MIRMTRCSVRRGASGALLVGVAALGAACNKSSQPVAAAERDKAAPAVGATLFTRMPASFTGIRFENRLTETDSLNVFTYRNFYNGGGVAIGDLNNDGRPDVVLGANQTGPRIFLNEGAFRFRDVTEAAGLGTPGAWTTGLTLADVNADGYLDLYVSQAGNGKPDTRRNRLWINDGATKDSVPTFTERAAQYGVADDGYTTQSAFFDYDRDGDLDLIVVNNSPRPASSFGLRNTRNERDQYGGDHLYRNDNGKFTDVTAAAGILGPEMSFGLGVGVADVNGDGWQDLYVANDFFEHDYLYLNNRNGTFTESMTQMLPNSSYFSMGMDMADVNNDGRPEIYTTDMLPKDEIRLRTMSSFEGWDVYQAKLRNGYGYQFMRNMLQRNNGDGTFSDVGQMAGVARTDWSWSALLMDLDLDGRKDVFVTNGLLRDVTSQDYIAFLANNETARRVAEGGKVDFLALTKAMTSTPIPDYAFRNTGDLMFEDVTAAWGLDAPNISSGAAYGDLDGDGALDLIVNNANQEVFVYRNNVRTKSPEQGFLQVALSGSGGNRFAIGARVTVHTPAAAFTQEVSPTRGFQSSVDYLLTFGLGAAPAVDSVVVRWPDGTHGVASAPARNSRVRLAHADAKAAPPEPARGAAVFSDVTAAAGVSFVHRENDFVDFDRERLMPKMLSLDGPAAAAADVNGDGLDDVYIGGAKEQPGQLMLQREDGSFAVSNVGLFAPDAVSEDVGAVFFDANGDRAPDLYVVSGGNDFGEQSPALQDRLYLNDGKGTFRKVPDALPIEEVSGSRPAVADVDGDGDLDLFIGGRSMPFRYGESGVSQLLINDGKGRFADRITTLAPGLQRVGMVTDAVFTDVDRDRRPDLVLVGDWMPVTVFRNAGGGRFTKLAVKGLEQSAGWWNRIVAADVTGDGRTDFVLGNMGLNGRLHASPTEPATMFVKDFDSNGSPDQIVACYEGGKSYPVVLRDEMIRALPPLKARFLSYAGYAKATVNDIFPVSDLTDAIQRRVDTFASSVLRNNGDGSFTLQPLPREAQLAPVFAILPDDVNGDGAVDLLLAGNFDGFKPDIARMSESHGTVLLGGASGSLTALPPVASGFRVPGSAREILRLRSRRGPLVLVARNSDRPLVFRGTGVVQ
jgi:enediyne biosynthesis protein E4